MKDKNTPFRSEINNSIRHIEFRSKNTLYACSESGDLLEFHIQNDTIFKNNKKKKIFNNNNVKVVNISNILVTTIILIVIAYPVFHGILMLMLMSRYQQFLRINMKFLQLDIKMVL